ncbi:MAG: hypothetical protein Q8P10_00070 [bacterium]|nr:hypothetical protein [bacterium]
MERITRFFRGIQPVPQEKAQSKVENKYTAQIAIYTPAHELRKDMQYVGTYQGKLDDGSDILELRWRGGQDATRSKGILVVYTTNKIDVKYTESDHWQDVSLDKIGLEQNLIKRLIDQEAKLAPENMKVGVQNFVERQRLADQGLNKN